MWGDLLDLKSSRRWWWWCWKTTTRSTMRIFFMMEQSLNENWTGGIAIVFFFSMIFEIQDSLLYWSWRTDQLPSISFLFIQVSHEFRKKLWIVSPVGRHQQNCLICKSSVGEWIKVMKIEKFLNIHSNHESVQQFLDLNNFNFNWQI